MRETLHETLLALQPYHYVIVKYGKIHGVFSNMDVMPIVGDTNGAELKIAKKSASNGKTAVDTNVLASIAKNTRLMEKILEEIPEYEYLTVTNKIIAIKQAFPRLKPAVISKIVNTTPNTVYKTLSIARKKGLIP